MRTFFSNNRAVVQGVGIWISGVFSGIATVQTYEWWKGRKKPKDSLTNKAIMSGRVEYIDVSLIKIPKDEGEAEKK